MYGERCNFIHKKKKEEWGELRRKEMKGCKEIMEEIRREEGSRLLKLLKRLP